MAWRGYLGRIEYHRKLADKVEQRQLDYFHCMATSKFVDSTLLDSALNTVYCT